jgi:uncharacterized protein
VLPYIPIQFQDLFSSEKPVIGCIHLMALPGAPMYEGDMQHVYEKAMQEVAIFEKHGIDGLIVENFRDKPFFPHSVPPQTVAALAAVVRDIVKSATVPVGVNALCNDTVAAMAIATAVQAQFIRVNIHM